MERDVARVSRAPGDSEVGQDRASRIEAVGFDYPSQSLERVAACDLCGDTHAVLVAWEDRYGLPVRSRVCRGCGLGYLSPRLTAGGYAEFYASYYRPLVSAHRGERVDEHTIQAEQRQYAHYVWELLAPGLEAGRTYDTIDIGGSTGVVLTTLRELARGMDVDLNGFILDPAPLEVGVARQQGLETAVGLAEGFQPGGRRWQVALLCQTIDHLLQIAPTLRKIHDLLTDDGVFFVDVVDWEFALRRNRDVAATVKVDHPFMLTPRVLEFYLAQVGFAPVAGAVSPSRHLVGFLCRKSAPVEPDPGAMRHHAEAMLRLVRQTQAEAN